MLKARSNRHSRVLSLTPLLTGPLWPLATGKIGQNIVPVGNYPPIFVPTENNQTNQSSLRNMICYFSHPHWIFWFENNRIETNINPHRVSLKNSTGSVRRGRSIGFEMKEHLLIELVLYTFFFIRTSKIFDAFGCS